MTAEPDMSRGTVKLAAARLQSVELYLSKLSDAVVDKCAHLGRDQLRRSVDHLHGNRFGFEFLQYVLQPAGFPVRRYHVGEKRSEAYALGSSGQGAIDLVAINDTADRYGHGAIAHPKAPLAARGQAYMSNAAVLADVVWHLRHSVTAEILFACAHHTAHATDRNSHHRGILEASDADRDINSFLDQIHQTIQQQQIGGYAGMTLEKSV